MGRGGGYRLEQVFLGFSVPGHSLAEGDGRGEGRGPCSVCSPQSSREGLLLLPAMPSLALGTPGRLVLVKQGLQQEGLVSEAVSTDKYLEAGGGEWGSLPNTPWGPWQLLQAAYPPAHSVPTRKTAQLPPFPVPCKHPLTHHPCSCHHQTTGPGCLLRCGHPSDTGICPFPYPVSPWGFTPQNILSV